MTTELQQKLSAIKQECQRAIELGEKATDAPWLPSEMFKDHVGTRRSKHGILEGEIINCDGRAFSRGEFSEAQIEGNMRFIAHSRTFSPAAAKGLLAMIEEAERCLAHHPMDIDEDHHAAIRILQSLAESWDKTMARR